MHVLSQAKRRICEGPCREKIEDLGRCDLVKLMHCCRDALSFSDPRSLIPVLRSPNKKSPSVGWAFEDRFWSERRGSNSRPSPWQGDALPAELLSQSDHKDTKYFELDQVHWNEKFTQRQKLILETDFFPHLVSTLHYLGHLIARRNHRLIPVAIYNAYKT